MSKPWKPGKKSVELNVSARPSRIRRDPVRLEKKVEAVTREREILGGVTGVLLFAAAIVALVVGIAVATFSNYDPAAAARAGHFGQCYNEPGPNCVVDGGTIYVGGEKVAIAGMEAPDIRGAACAAEQSRGIEAALRLADLLNSGKVTVSRTFTDEYGRDVRKVQVKDKDVGKAMIEAGLARTYNGKNKSWCG